MCSECPNFTLTPRVALSKPSILQTWVFYLVGDLVLRHHHKNFQLPGGPFLRGEKYLWSFGTNWRKLIFIFSNGQLATYKATKIVSIWLGKLPGCWDMMCGVGVCVKDHVRWPKYDGRWPRYDGRQPKIVKSWPFCQDDLWPGYVLKCLVMIRPGHRITCIGSGWSEDSGRWPRYDGRRLRYDGRRPSILKRS